MLISVRQVLNNASWWRTFYSDIGRHAYEWKMRGVKWGWGLKARSNYTTNVCHLLYKHLITQLNSITQFLKVLFKIWSTCQSWIELVTNHDSNTRNINRLCSMAETELKFPSRVLTMHLLLSGHPLLTLWCDKVLDLPSLSWSWCLIILVTCWCLGKSWSFQWSA